MRRGASGVLVAAMLLLLAGAPAAAAPWVEEPFDRPPGEVFTDGWGYDGLGTGLYGTGMDVEVPAGSHFGTHRFLPLEQPDVERVWWRYFLRIDPTSLVEPRQGIKLPGVANVRATKDCYGNRPSRPERPCFSVRGVMSRLNLKWGEPGYPDPGPTDVSRLGFYVYHLDQYADFGQTWMWDLETGTVRHGEWACIEGALDLNTPGAADGRLRGFVDGAPAFDRDGLRFRRAGEGAVDVTEFWWDVYHGGADVSAHRIGLSFDELALGPERIGCEITWDGTFRDDDGHRLEPDIEWLAASGITQGCGELRFCPNDPVSRGQMARFLVRAGALPAAPPAGFVDVPPDHIFADDISRLAAAGITTGYADGTFRPGLPVTRGEMAWFLSRARGLAPQPSSFADVGPDLAPAVGALLAAGITEGCAPARYCPAARVTREQMAAFLHRADAT